MVGYICWMRWLTDNGADLWRILSDSHSVWQRALFHGRFFSRRHIPKRYLKRLRDSAPSGVGRLCFIGIVKTVDHPLPSQLIILTWNAALINI